jgi:hypothetical protein
VGWHDYPLPKEGQVALIWLIDASDRVEYLRSGHQALVLRPGRYLATANYYRSTGLAIIVREICWIE